MGVGSVLSDVFVSIECIFLTVLLFWLYHKQKISAIELILYSFACSTFFIPFISNTVTPLFFVSTYFLLSEGLAFVRGRKNINISLAIVLLLPILSSLIIAAFLFFGLDIFDGNNPSIARVLFDGLFFYVKYFLPFVFMGTRIYREGRRYNADYFFSIIKRVAIVSCYIGLFQLFLSIIIKDEFVLRIFGLRTTYLSYTAGGHEANTARVSAFFVEPKFLASFLVVSFPLFLRDKKIMPIILVFIVGLFTASQTFTAGILVTVILFFVIRNVSKIRLNIALGLLIILVSFYSISLLKVTLLDFYMAHSDNYVVSLLLSRAIDRYDVDKEDQVNTQILGIPLQKDSDLPIALFFSTKPFLLLSGYGIKNGGFIPPKYYIFNEEGFKDVGSLTYNLDFRWFYFVCEFGLIIFLIWLWFFTRKFDSAEISRFERKYYAFLIVFLFFNGIELIIILLYSFYKGYCYYKNLTATQYVLID